MNYTVIGDNEALKELQSIVLKIKESSPQNAVLVKDAVFSFTKTLENNPSRCANFKNNNGINARLHIIKRLKIIFEVVNEHVFITKVIYAKKPVY